MAFVDSNSKAASSRRAASAHEPSACANGDSAALSTLLVDLAGKPAAAWLEAGRELALNRDLATASALLQAALTRHVDDSELRLALASVRWQMQDHAGARVLLETLLARDPGHVAAALSLARLHVELGRIQMAEALLCDLFGRFHQPPNLILRAAKMLADAGCKHGAADLCEAAIAAGSDNSLVHVYAAAMQSQLGKFECSRGHYMFALEHDSKAVDVGAAYGLATIKRYTDPADPDLARFGALLGRSDLAPGARASVLFALGKVHDDLGDFAQAAIYLRRANGLVDHDSWSRKHWRRMIEAKLAGTSLPQRTSAATECVPVFVVGAPRSGTTLVAELLGRSHQVCNRGELDLLPDYAEEVAHAGRPDASLLDGIAESYLARLQMDEAKARWFVDKQPLNFLHVDLVRALFPQARIIYCRRNQRDTALSIWSQNFASAEYRFAYDFTDIAVVLKDCERLMAKARDDSRLLEVRYEELVREPQAIVDGLAAELGLARFDCRAPNARRSVIGTASVWQARQPVYQASVGRWRHYVPYVPELERFEPRD